jgi:hypothetical protein
VSLIYADPGRRGGPERDENAEKIVSRKRSGPHTQTTVEVHRPPLQSCRNPSVRALPMRYLVRNTAIQKPKFRLPTVFHRDSTPQSSCNPDHTQLRSRTNTTGMFAGTTGRVWAEHRCYPLGTGLSFSRSRPLVHPDKCGPSGPQLWSARTTSVVRPDHKCSRSDGIEKNVLLALKPY